MSLWRLIFREILRRRVNFMLGVLSVAVAVTVLVGSLGRLAGHDRRTRTILAESRARTKQRLERQRHELATRVAKLNDEIRAITKQMGFNVFILPKDLDLTDFFAEGYASTFMPEAYVETLAASPIVTVRHLLPILEQRVTWAEQGGRRIVLVGTRGEVPIAQNSPKKPITHPVPPGRIVMGYELWKGLSLNVGSKIRLLGRQFTVARCREERGTKDDITAWINLAEAQEMLSKKGWISAIWALECRCAWADLAKVRAEIARILPNTQVKEVHSKALARAEARRRVAEQGKEAERRSREQAATALREQAADRAQLRGEIETLAAVVVPLTLAGVAAWVGLLAYVNVRRRREEIGILRAVGLRSGQICFVFLARAALVGLIGAVVGCAGGLAVVVATTDGGAALVSLTWLAAILAAAPALCALAGWAPAILAGRQDPAVILQME